MNQICKINFRGRTIKYCGNNQFWERVAAEMWESDTFNLLEKQIIAGKIFIDCGAWNGVLSIYAAMLGARVYAIEPDAAIWNELECNIHENGLQDLITWKSYALSDKKGTAQLVNDYGNFGNSGSKLSTSTGKTVTTNTLSFLIEDEKINAADICLIKIDVEGSEIALIRGAKYFLQTYRPLINISFHPAYFENFDEDILYAYNTLSEIYVFEGSNFEDFVQRMMNPLADHNFTLIPK